MNPDPLDLAAARKDGRPDRSNPTPAEQEVAFLKAVIARRDAEILELRREKRGLMAQINEMLGRSRTL